MRNYEIKCKFDLNSKALTHKQTPKQRVKVWNFKVGLSHSLNQINEMNDWRGGRRFESPLK